MSEGRQRGAKVDGRRGLPDAALLIDDRERAPRGCDSISSSCARISLGPNGWGQSQSSTSSRSSEEILQRSS